MSSMLLSMEKPAGGEIVSNLCRFQAKESQTHSLLSGEAVGGGYAPVTPWRLKSQRRKQVPANKPGGGKSRSPTSNPPLRAQHHNAGFTDCPGSLLPKMAQGMGCTPHGAAAPQFSFI